MKARDLKSGDCVARMVFDVKIKDSFQMRPGWVHVVFEMPDGTTRGYEIKDEDEIVCRECEPKDKFVHELGHVPGKYMIR